MSRPAQAPRRPTAAHPASALLATVLLTACSGTAADGDGEQSPQPPAAGTPPGSSSPSEPSGSRVRAAFRELEATYGARVGVHAVDTATGRTVQHRGDERLPYASTVKVLAAGAVLDELSPAEQRARVRWTAGDLVEHSPVTEQHLGDGLTAEQLVEAAVVESDNTAANLLFELLGGPAALEERLRERGDAETSVDRVEPFLNSAVPGDVRDTTTPRALATTFASYVVGDVLPAADRRLLVGSLLRSTTGTGLVRAGVPAGWEVGDKSGTAAYGTRNDVAVVTPPGRAPWVVAVLTTRTEGAEPSDALVAAATRVVVAELS